MKRKVKHVKKLHHCLMRNDMQNGKPMKMAHKRALKATY